jgi:hypothetical protein
LQEVTLSLPFFMAFFGGMVMNEEEEKLEIFGSSAMVTA